MHPAESAYAGNQNMVGSPRWSAAATSSPASTWTIARPPTRSWNAFATATPASCSTVPPLEQNLQLTRDVVRVARPAGVSVEAEVGTIGTTAEYGAEIENPHLADPAACEAMGETGIDALAVAISNAHGVYIADPNSTSTSSPKSDGAPKCHWCCTAAQQSRSTRSRRRSAGAAKMNVGTAIHVAFNEGMEEGRIPARTTS